MISLNFICAIICLCLAISSAEDISTTLMPNSSPLVESSMVPATTVAAAAAVMDSSTKPADTTVVMLSPATTVGNGLTDSTVANEIYSSTSALLNNLVDEGTTPSWELIYPDPNSTLREEKPIKQIMTSQGAKGDSFSEGVSKYFKVDDAVNCEKYFGECLRQVLSNVMPKLRNSMNDSRLSSAIDPFYVNRSSFQYNGGPLNGRITVGYAYVYGLTSMKYRKVIFKRTAGNNFKMRLSSTIPVLLAKGSYKTDLKLNSVDVRPKGDMNVTLYGVTVEQLGYGEIAEENQHRFLKLNAMNVTASVGDAKINATGLIADSRLNNIILNVANQYWRDIFNIVLPETQDNWSPIIMTGLNRAFSMVPLDFLQKV